MHEDFSRLTPLETCGDDRFVVRPPGSGFLFGGLSMAATLRAAAATVTPDRRPLSLRATFLAGGDWGGPHELRVERISDTGSFAVRRIEFFTQDRLAVVSEVVFHQPDQGEDWQAPDHLAAPAAETLEPFDSQLPANVIDIRPVNPASGKLERLHPYWCRPREQLVDPTLTACALAYISDYWVIGSPFAPGSGAGEGLVSRTYSHSIVFHRTPEVADWWLFDCQPVSVSGGRYFSRGGVQSTRGLKLASFEQLGFIRPIRRPGGAVRD
jgi:acyl-CoA thioesterase-2